MQPAAGSLARDGSGDVDEVAVAVSARTEHGVGEDDGVGLRPGDVAPNPGTRIHLVRRACPGLPAPQIDVRLHEIAAALRHPLLVVGVLEDQVRVDEVDGADVDGRGHAHLAAQLDELLREVQARLAVEDAAIDVDRVDLDQALGPTDAGQLGDDAHRQGDGRTLLPRQHGLLLGREGERHVDTVVDVVLHLECCGCQGYAVWKGIRGKIPRGEWDAP